MPNRIIKESLCDSEKIASLSDFEFRLWVGLITQADDAGRGDARPAYIKGHVFPFRDRIAAKDIEAALHALAAKGCVSLYTVGGKPYFWFPSWAKHQRIRDCKPKYPGIDESDNLPTFAASCSELPQTAASCGLNTIQSESNPNTNPNLNPNPESNARKTRMSDKSRFEKFWETYPKHKSKGDAEKAFKKINPSDALLQIMLLSIEMQKQSRQWNRDDGQYIPYPATWLNRRCWEDETCTRDTDGGNVFLDMLEEGL